MNYFKQFNNLNSQLANFFINCKNDLKQKKMLAFQTKNEFIPLKIFRNTMPILYANIEIQNIKDILDRLDNTIDLTPLFENSTNSENFDGSDEYTDDYNDKGWYENWYKQWSNHSFRFLLKQEFKKPKPRTQEEIAEEQKMIALQMIHTRLLNSVIRYTDSEYRIKLFEKLINSEILLSNNNEIARQINRELGIEIEDVGSEITLMPIEACLITEKIPLSNNLYILDDSDNYDLDDDYLDLLLYFDIDPEENINEYFDLIKIDEPGNIDLLFPHLFFIDPGYPESTSFDIAASYPEITSFYIDAEYADYIGYPEITAFYTDGEYIDPGYPEITSFYIDAEYAEINPLIDVEFLLEMDRDIQYEIALEIIYGGVHPQFEQLKMEIEIEMERERERGNYPKLTLREIAGIIKNEIITYYTIHHNNMELDSSFEDDPDFDGDVERNILTEVKDQTMRTLQSIIKSEELLHHIESGLDFEINHYMGPLREQIQRDIERKRYGWIQPQIKREIDHRIAPETLSDKFRIIAMEHEIKRDTEHERKFQIERESYLERLKDDEIDREFDPAMEREISRRIKADVDADVDAEVDAEVDADVDADFDADFDAEMDSEMDSEMELEMESEIDRKMRREFDPAMEREINRRIEAEINPLIEAEINRQIEAEINPLIEAEIDRQIDAEINSQIEAEIAHRKRRRRKMDSDFEYNDDDSDSDNPGNTQSNLSNIHLKHYDAGNLLGNLDHSDNSYHLHHLDNLTNFKNLKKFKIVVNSKNSKNKKLYNSNNLNNFKHWDDFSTLNLEENPKNVGNSDNLTNSMISLKFSKAIGNLKNLKSTQFHTPKRLFKENKLWGDLLISLNSPLHSSYQKLSQKSSLLEFGQDLTFLAKEKKLAPCFGRDKELTRLMEILIRRQKNNPVLIGDAGVGKTAIVELFADRMVNRTVPLVLQGRRIVSIDLARIVAGTRYRGDFEGKFQKLVDEIRDQANITIFIDEMHTLIGTGSAEGSLDAANMLKPVLSRSGFQCIGATTAKEYERLQKDPALNRRFQPIVIEEPSIKQAISILYSLRPNLEAFHNVQYSGEAIEQAVTLSVRYINDRYLPDKAIDLIDRAGARKVLTVTLPGSKNTIFQAMIDTSLLNIRRLRDEAYRRGDLTSQFVLLETEKAYSTFYLRLLGKPQTIKSSFIAKSTKNRTSVIVKEPTIKKNSLKKLNHFFYQTFVAKKKNKFFNDNIDNSLCCNEFFFSDKNSYLSFITDSQKLEDEREDEKLLAPKIFPFIKNFLASKFFSTHRKIKEVKSFLLLKKTIFSHSKKFLCRQLSLFDDFCFPDEDFNELQRFLDELFFDELFFFHPYVSHVLPFIKKKYFDYFSSFYFYQNVVFQNEDKDIFFEDCLIEENILKRNKEISEDKNTFNEQFFFLLRTKNSPNQTLFLNFLLLLVPIEKNYDVKKLRKKIEEHKALKNKKNLFSLDLDKKQKRSGEINPKIRTEQRTFIGLHFFEQKDLFQDENQLDDFSKNSKDIYSSIWENFVSFFLSTEKIKSEKKNLNNFNFSNEFTKIKELKKKQNKTGIQRHSYFSKDKRSNFPKIKTKMVLEERKNYLKLWEKLKSETFPILPSKYWIFQKEKTNSFYDKSKKRSLTKLTYPRKILPTEKITANIVNDFYHYQEKDGVSATSKIRPWSKKNWDREFETYFYVPDLLENLDVSLENLKDLLAYVEYLWLIGVADEKKNFFAEAFPNCPTDLKFFSAHYKSSFKGLSSDTKLLRSLDPKKITTRLALNQKKKFSQVLIRFFDQTLEVNSLAQELHLNKVANLFEKYLKEFSINLKSDPKYIHILHDLERRIQYFNLENFDYDQLRNKGIYAWFFRDYMSTSWAKSLPKFFSLQEIVKIHYHFYGPNSFTFQELESYAKPRISRFESEKISKKKKNTRPEKIIFAESKFMARKLRTYIAREVKKIMFASMKPGLIPFPEFGGLAPNKSAKISNSLAFLDQESRLAFKNISLNRLASYLFAQYIKIARKLPFDFSSVVFPYVFKNRNHSSLLDRYISDFRPFLAQKYYDIKWDFLWEDVENIEAPRKKLAEFDKKQHQILDKYFQKLKPVLKNETLVELNKDKHLFPSSKDEKIVHLLLGHYTKSRSDFLLSKAKEEAKIRAEEALNRSFVSAYDICKLLGEMTGIPLETLSIDDSSKFDNLESSLHKRVIGQEGAIKALSNALRRSRLGIQNPNRPIGCFMFCGPTGVGKTEVTKALTEHMFGNEKAMIRFDMSEFTDKFNLSRLIGSPPGYVGYEDGGQLTDAVRRKPYAVVLFDEIEKAHPDVLNILLQIMEDGRLTDSQKRVVNFENTIIVLTSNAAASDILALLQKNQKEMEKNKEAKNSFRSEGKKQKIKLSEKEQKKAEYATASFELKEFLESPIQENFAQDLKKKILDSLQSIPDSLRGKHHDLVSPPLDQDAFSLTTFKKDENLSTSKENLKEQVIEKLTTVFLPEFLNRLDDIIIFEPLQPDQLRKICDIMLNQLAVRIKSKNIFLRIDDAVKNKLAKDAYSPFFGARPLRRLITKHIEDLLAATLFAYTRKTRDLSGPFVLKVSLDETDDIIGTLS